MQHLEVSGAVRHIYIYIYIYIYVIRRLKVNYLPLALHESAYTDAGTSVHTAQTA